MDTNKENKNPLDPALGKSELARNEEKILEFWKENNIFQKTLDKPSTKGEFVFYEGPPTANAKPALHHLEARAFKDVIPRYKTMQGFHVRRKAGWDTHGLPVELQIEKKLGLKSKKEIEQYGVAKFNKECKESVHEYIDLWKTFTERMGYWVDFNDAYYTYDANYIESLWSVVGEINKRGLLYKDYKVVPWCPRCGTVLSSHELAQGYEDDKDLSVYVKFKVVGEDNTYILAWTTTPWTLPGNVALAVGDDIDYVKVKVGGEILIIAKSRIVLFEADIHEVVGDLKGSDLAGLSYESLYPYLSDLDKGNDRLQNAYKVYTADFVTTTDGTGIVHIAPMYGQDDFALGTKNNLPKIHTVDETGHFVKGTGFLEGRFVKEVDGGQSGGPGKPTLAVDIIEDLKKQGLFFKQENIKHSYPHCWRCKTALIYYARDSWYIGMSKLRNELLAENEKINWEPAHIKEGRFGEWLDGIKDWAISRERYWGTPLPIWMSADGERLIVDSFDTLKKYGKKSGNRYLVMRHGEAENNIAAVISCKDFNQHHLTEKGKDQTGKSAELLKDNKIDMIFASPFARTRETAEVTAGILGLSPDQIIVDERLHEVDCGVFDGKSLEEYHSFFAEGDDRFTKAPEGGESYSDVKKRIGDFIYDIENKYVGKNILIVTHDSPAWMFFAVTQGFDKDQTKESRKDSIFFIENAEVRELPFVPLPHNENFELDPHRPFIDEIVLEKDGKEFHRIKEVMDVWFDSGAMPFAQDHYPFENREPVYPADFISEAIDQTRGWFYTLLAVGVLMNRGTPYKNVICLGHLLDAQGKKMSKSIGNIVEPFEQMNKFGVDAVRFWMYSVNQPGESKNYDEKTVAEINNKVFNLLYNVLSFYELYRDSSIEQGSYTEVSANILDKWIVSRLNQLTELATENLDNYKILEPARAIKDFIGDLSTWYLRRSRDRIKEGDREAKRTLYFVLKNLSKIMAPFTPFTAEDVWLKLRVEQNKESIHLTNWPTLGEIDHNLLENMEMVRRIVTSGLEARQKAGIKVRQPLLKIITKSKSLGDQYAELIKDELNVKEVVFDEKITNEVELDITINSELKLEGDYRELLRFIQDLRKKGDLVPSDHIVLEVETDAVGQELISKFNIDLKKSAQVKEIEFKSNDGAEVKIGDLLFKIEIKK